MSAEHTLSSEEAKTFPNLPPKEASVGNKGLPEALQVEQPHKTDVELGIRRLVKNAVRTLLKPQ
jgi:hypothetical protein